MYIDKIDDTVNKFRNIYHSTIKMEAADVELNTYFYFKKENNKEDLRSKVHDHVRISNYKSIFEKDYIRKRSDDVFHIKNRKNIVPYVIRDREDENESQKTKKSPEESKSKLKFA